MAAAPAPTVEEGLKMGGSIHQPALGTVTRDHGTILGRSIFQAGDFGIHLSRKTPFLALRPSPSRLAAGVGGG